MLKNLKETARLLLFLPSLSQPSQVLRQFSNAVIMLVALEGSALISSTASGQRAEPTHQAGHRIGLIDVGYVFKNLPAIKADVRKLEADSRKDQDESKRERDQLKQAVEHLKALKVGTAEYARQEERVANLDAKFRLIKVHKHQDPSDARVKLYFENYQRIVAAVRVIATRKDINLVLRFNGEESDPDQDKSDVRGVTWNVVYHDSTIDLTDAVMRYLEQPTNTSQAASDDNASAVTNR
ncbi:OmpH family outer membrane protein [Roseiconus nitratireducens]|uniref:OmpH family outer membrane protein n=1 Tax=Roseiconus nitratireducens TaxID=2605748 RepID=A0A5M6D6W0_9BACT|nr:OmpH family outer membrane protein [Roseiconus nitratireducens]KAA5542270.1 OmpH family outer membrane protein [Roseiconus nitratireducens]